MCYARLQARALESKTDRVFEHYAIVPLPQEALTQERMLKLLERGFEILSGDPDKAGAPFVIRIYNLENQIACPTGIRRTNT